MCIRDSAMTDLRLEPLVRRFKIGSLELPDPAPGLPPGEAVKAFAVTYPHCANALLGEPEVRDGTVSYTHLDVYKGQARSRPCVRRASSTRPRTSVTTPAMTWMGDAAAAGFAGLAKRRERDAGLQLSLIHI